MLRTTIVTCLGFVLLTAECAWAASAVERLNKALQEAQRLQALAEGVPDERLHDVQPEADWIDDRERSPARRFARASHVVQYASARPWAYHYVHLFERRGTPRPVEAWPGLEDAPALRALLAGEDPLIRGLAIEALATLHQPEDVPRIAALLEDAAESAPVLGHSRQMTAMAMGPELMREPEKDPILMLRTWHPRAVKAYARHALDLMTHKQFAGRKAFEQWWRPRQEPRHTLWYWQRRLQIEMERVYLEHERLGLPPRGIDYRQWYERWERSIEAEQERARRPIAEELAKLPAEVDAKVRLLAVFERAGAAGLPERLFPDPPKLRISTDRLFELLNGQNLWEDVNWEHGYNNDGLMVRRIALAAAHLFSAENVPRLRAVLEKHHGQWQETVLAIGLARLLQAGGEGDLDDPAMRDGVLRDAIRRITGTYPRGELTRELVRVGLPRNWPFIKGIFFEEGQTHSTPDVRMSILRELGTAPLTPGKRAALADLLLDDRATPLLTRPSERMGDDLYRQYAIESINAHAGREVLTHIHRQDLGIATRSAKALAELREAVIGLRQ